MGCCVSTNKGFEDGPVTAKHQHLKEGSPHQTSKSPPPSLDEETVKEVLSETPVPKSFPLQEIQEDQNKASTLAVSNIEEEQENREHEVPPPKVEQEKAEKKDPVNVTEEISEVSEICSLSESISTTTITERREDEDRSRDDGEVRQRVGRSPAKVLKKRSFSGECAGRAQRGGKSPARRSEPSPSPRKRNDNVLKPVQGTEAHQTTRRRILSSNVPRRDCGESSGRRSRSPATRTEGGVPRGTQGRNPSLKRTGKSPSRVAAASAATENGRKMEETKEGNPPSSKESLENPLVSLECFIFL